MGVWAFSFPKHFPTQCEFPKGNVPGYVCNHGSLRERDSLPYFLHPCERHASTYQKLTLLVSYALLCSLVSTSPSTLRRNMTFRHSVGLISHVIQSVGTKGRSKAFPTQRLIPSRNHGSLSVGHSESRRVTDELGSRLERPITTSVSKRANAHWHAIIASSCC